MTDYPIHISDNILQALRGAGWLEQPTVRGAIPPADAATLEYVRAHPNEETIAIAGAFGVRRSAMCARLGRLARRGYVQASYEGNVARWRVC